MLATLCAVMVAVSSAPPETAAQPVEIAVWAVQAVKTGSPEKRFDAASLPLRNVIEDLPYDTFRGVFSGSATVAPGTENRLALNDSYTLLVQCRSRESKDKAHIDISVELPPAQAGGACRKAIQSCMVLCTGKKVRIGGLKMKEGEMIIVLEMKG